MVMQSALLFEVQTVQRRELSGIGASAGVGIPRLAFLEEYRRPPLNNQTAKLASGSCYAVAVDCVLRLAPLPHHVNLLLGDVSREITCEDTWSAAQSLSGRLNGGLPRALFTLYVASAVVICSTAPTS